MADDIIFEDKGVPTGESVDLDSLNTEPTVEQEEDNFPPAILDITEEDRVELVTWIDEWLQNVISSQQMKQDDWDKQEESYRALPGPKLDKPYVGASNETVPAIAMAVDPIHARLETGVFKQNPVFTVKALKKSVLPYVDSIEAFVEYYQKHQLKLRRISSPRLLECAKLGTCFYKTVYDNETYEVLTYDDEWKVVKKKITKFAGPRVFGISIGDLLFPPLYQDIQQCPFVAERIRTTYSKLKVAEASKKLKDVDKIKDQTNMNRTPLEDARMRSTHHQESLRRLDEHVVYEIWCDYDINNDDLPEHLVITYHYETQTILQLRLNWYFHQRKPYTVIPYSVTNDSIYGLGLCEMVKPFQDLLTKWHRMATDNAYLVNIRMFIAKKECGIEEVPKLYSGRTFFVDDPSKDFIPFGLADVYPSTLTERQNIFGLIEKRTGVSDYLVGRESPIIGSRATATSTVALIEEGTKRVEQVLENIRAGMAEIIENCIYIWIQYGPGTVNEIVFGDDEIGAKVSEFFDLVRQEDVAGTLAIDLSATDASTSRHARQQMQLALIQVMMGYFEKVLAAGQGMFQYQQTMPQMASLIADTATAARMMFKDLLIKYDVKNPDAYLIDLDKYVNSEASVQPDGTGGAGDLEGLLSGLIAQSGVAPNGAGVAGPAVPQPATPGAGGSPEFFLPLAGGSRGIQG